MAKWLSEEWMDQLVTMSASQPVRPGVNARMQYEVVGGPEGDSHYYWIIQDGVLKEAKTGKLDDAEMTLSQSYEDALRITKGEMDANTAFMQGRIKVTGDMGKLMSLLPLTNSPEYKQLQDEVLAATDF